MTPAPASLPPFPPGLAPPGTRRRARAVLAGAAGALDVLTTGPPATTGRGHHDRGHDDRGADVRGDGGRAGGALGGWQVDDDLLDAHLLLPHVIAVANATPLPPAPPPPWPAPGGGWVAVDLGPDDDETWHTFCTVLADEQRAGRRPADAEEFASRAQEWRLAVTPYRRSANHRMGADGAPADGTTGDLTPGGRVAGAHAPAGRATAPLAGVRIVDLTAMWAGPLATWLAAGLGAEVIRVEPACRPDGFRRGARPSGLTDGPGALFVALDHGKHHHLDLDLRRTEDRERFDGLVAGADVVIDSFSRRVRPNLGIDADRLAAVRPGLIDVSVTAFPEDGAEADWVAYGGGVHAASGLAFHPPAGVTGPGTGGPAVGPWPAPVPYADPLTGLEAFRAVVDGLVARRQGRRGPLRRNVSLAGAIGPLNGWSDGTDDHDHRGDGDDGLAAWLAAAARLTVAHGPYRVLPLPLRRETRS